MTTPHKFHSHCECRVCKAIGRGVIHVVGDQGRWPRRPVDYVGGAWGGVLLMHLTGPFSKQSRAEPARSTINVKIENTIEQ